jgi:PHF5-like protein
MAKHHPDLVMCRKQPGIAIGRLCEKCKFLILWVETKAHPSSSTVYSIAKTIHSRCTLIRIYFLFILHR